jgi:hypothetical protein
LTYDNSKLQSATLNLPVGSTTSRLKKEILEERLMDRFVISLVMVVVVVYTALAQAPRKNATISEIEKQLLRINKEYDEALVRSDVKALDPIFGAEFIYTSTSGEVSISNNSSSLSGPER